MQKGCSLQKTTTLQKLLICSIKSLSLQVYRQLIFLQFLKEIQYQNFALKLILAIHLIPQQYPIEFDKVLWEKIVEITLKYTKFTREELDDIKRCKTDKYMTSQEMLIKGCVDEVI